MFSSFQWRCCSVDCLLGYVTGYCIKYFRSFPSNITINSSGLLHLVQVDFEVIVWRNRVDYTGSLQGLLPIRAVAIEEGINIKEFEVSELAIWAFLLQENKKEESDVVLWRPYHWRTLSSGRQDNLGLYKLAEVSKQHSYATFREAEGDNRFFQKLINPLAPELFFF